MKYFLILLFIILHQHYLFSNQKKNLPIQEENEEFKIPLTEDLMREHGVLNRILLIYEEIIKRIENNTPFPIAAISNAVNIIQSFIENYHEKLEEEYIFPLFEKHKKEIQLTKILKKQHNKGREITAQLQKLLATKKLDKDNKNTIKNLLQKFITMYRPHEAREDTILFPQIRSLISEKKFKELGETFEDLEHELFGSDGFATIVHKVAAIEKELGIYNLAQFTPK
jgi:hemerythrin-like domain-containing protein